MQFYDYAQAYSHASAHGHTHAEARAHASAHAQDKNKDNYYLFTLEAPLCFFLDAVFEDYFKSTGNRYS